MKRTTLSHHPCSIARTLDIVGEWWTPLILRNIAYGIRRFGEIQEDLGISANILTDRLEALSSQGLLEVRVYQERPRRHEYHLTEKGAELIPALLALMQWGDRWTWPDGTGPVRMVHEECGHEVRVEVDCPHCERNVGIDELRAKPRTALPPSHPGSDEQPGQQRPGEVSGRRLYAAEHGVPLGA
jgi:DNA-binding HxlR family transcriptional regulator